MEDSCVVGVKAVFTVSRFAGESPNLLRGSSLGVDGIVTIAAVPNPGSMITLEMGRIQAASTCPSRQSKVVEGMWGEGPKRWAWAGDTEIDKWELGRCYHFCRLSSCKVESFQTPERLEL